MTKTDSVQQVRGGDQQAGYKVLSAAILISLAWHLFCMSVVKVIPAKAGPSQVRFSKVAFLGQILSKVSLGVKAGTRERTFLEKRFNSMYSSRAEAALVSVESSKAPEGGRAAEVRTGADTERKIAYMIEDAVSGPKVEADRVYD